LAQDMSFTVDASSPVEWVHFLHAIAVDTSDKVAEAFDSHIRFLGNSRTLLGSDASWINHLQLRGMTEAQVAQLAFFSGPGAQRRR
jgi:hypothetical protein